MPVHIEGMPPTYYIVAGLVFTTVCVPYLKSEYGKDYDYDALVKLLDRMMHDMVKEPGQNVVVVSQVLAADINIGYEEIVNTMVKGFNGKPVNNLKQLAKMVEACKEEYLRFELDHEILVVLKTKDALKETKEILESALHPKRQVRGSAVRRRETHARGAFRDDTNDARANDVCARGALHKDRPALAGDRRRRLRAKFSYENTLFSRVAAKAVSRSSVLRRRRLEISLPPREEKIAQHAPIAPLSRARRGRPVVPPSLRPTRASRSTSRRATSVPSPPPRSPTVPPRRLKTPRTIPATPPRATPARASLAPPPPPPPTTISRPPPPPARAPTR